jgi:GNAT superfamily N-acetyltransferase
MNPMDVSFGIEFEFDVIRSDGYKIRDVFYDGWIYVDGWGHQDDHTCSVELRTPVFTSIDQAIDEITRQFNYWCDELEDYAPYPYNQGTRSLGQHIHIGRPDSPLKDLDRYYIAKSIANIYPFLASLQAQPIPSRRGLTTTYAAPIWYYDWMIPHSDHYCEISRSHHGTVEFRLFDANIPQVSLVNVWFMTNIADNILRIVSDHNQFDITLDRERYRRDRENGLRYGLRALDIKHYLEYYSHFVGNIEIPNYPFLKEILYLACKYRLNPYNIKQLANPNEYYYFRYMFTRPGRYLSNLIGLIDVSRNTTLHNILSDVMNNAQSINNLSDLIRIAESTIPTVSRIYEIPLHSRNLPSRSYVKECIQVGTYRIRRITDVPGYTSYDVAERISYLLRHHGDGFVNLFEPDQIIDDPRRFYVLTVYDNSSNRYAIVGCIAIRMSSGEISSLVVDRRYRRLGIADILLRHVMNISERPVWGFVRKENQGMISLLRNLGFEFEQGNDRSLRFYLPQNRRDQ